MELRYSKYRYLAVQCPYCGEFRAINCGVKTFTCFRCGRRVKIESAKIIGGANHYSEIAELVRKAKIGKLKSQGP